MSFISDYRIVTQNNEVPPSFHLYSGLVALASLLGARVWTDFGLFRIRPNLYVVLTGDAGIKKTTAMAVTKRYLRSFKDQVPLSAEAQTKEALVQDMASYSRVCKVGVGEVPKEFAPLTEECNSFMYCPITVCVTELSQFVGAGSSHMVDFLTTVYDEPIYTNSTKNKGTDSLPMPCLNMLACTVPDWITSQMKSDVISSGFARRVIFVYEEEKQPRVAFPTITDEMEEAWDRLIEYGKQILKISGPMTWGPGAKDFFKTWYENLSYPPDPMMQGWANSVHIQMIKIAMLISVSESLDKVLTVESMQMSIALIEQVEVNIPKVFRSLGRNELHGTGTTLIKLLSMTEMKALPEREVKAHLFREVDPSDFNKVIIQLTQTGKIKKVLIDKVTYYQLIE